MPQLVGSSALLMVWCVGIGGSALALGCLLLERLFGRRSGRVPAALAGLALSSCAVIAGVAGHPVGLWGPIGAFALIFLVAWAVHYTAFLRFARRLARPQVIWAVLLIASPLYVTYATWGINAASWDIEAFDHWLVGLSEASGVRLLTDRGREIGLFSFILSEDAQQAEQEWVAEGRLECHVIQTAKLDPASNCHGWVFTGGRFAVRSQDVGTILQDNGYQPVEIPRKGDLIVYRGQDGAVLHSGTVLEVVDGPLVLVESKWGPLGRYLHPPEYQPYGTNFTYYRSNRQGHQLRVVPVT